jgi:hypothetical protein
MNAHSWRQFFVETLPLHFASRPGSAPEQAACSLIAGIRESGLSVLRTPTGWGKWWLLAAGPHHTS